MYHMEMDYTVFTYALIIFVSEYYVRKYTLIFHWAIFILQSVGLENEWKGMIIFRLGFCQTLPGLSCLFRKKQ